MSTPPPDSTELFPARWQDVSTHFEYLKVREVAAILQKGKSRMYEMIGQGLLDEVGWITFRAPNGRLWIGIPRPSLSGLKFFGKGRFL